MAAEGQFQLDSSGHKPTYTNFKDGEPKNNEDKDCVIANDDGKWSMSKCDNSKAGYICELGE